MFCFSCATADASGGEEWNPAMVRQLYKQSLKANNGRLIVHGLFARANSVNNNMRLYPKKILAREVRKYVRDQVQAKCALGELDHPSYCAPTFKHLNLVNISHQVLSVRWRGNTLWGFIEVLDTPSGRLIKHLYSRGCKLGVSSRGWASLRELPGKDYKCIMDNFELITFDFVTEPSTRGAWLLPYAGSYHQGMPQQPFAESVSRLGIGAVLPEQFPMLPGVREISSCLKEYRGHLRETSKCFPVRRMQGAKDWSLSERRKRENNGDGRRRSEPAATDTTIPGIGDAVCRGMADGFPMAVAPLISRTEDPAAMMVPVATSVIMAYPSGFQQEARVCYGAYVALAHVFGVPSQRGLRDYWRHVFLFRERALIAAQVEPVPSPMPAAGAATTAVVPVVPAAVLPPRSGGSIQLPHAHSATTSDLPSASSTPLVQETQTLRSEKSALPPDHHEPAPPSQSAHSASVVAANRPRMPGMLVWDNGNHQSSHLLSSRSAKGGSPELRQGSVALQFDRWRSPERDQGSSAAASSPDAQLRASSGALPVVCTGGGKAEIIHPAQAVSSHRHTRTGSSSSTVLDFRTQHSLSGGAAGSSLGSSPVKSATLIGDSGMGHQALGPNGPGVAVAASAMFGEHSSMHGSGSGLGVLGDTAFDAASGSCESAQDSDTQLHACIAPAAAASSSVSSRFGDVDGEQEVRSTMSATHGSRCGGTPQQLLLFQMTDPSTSCPSSLGKASHMSCNTQQDCSGPAPPRVYTASPPSQYSLSPEGHSSAYHHAPGVAANVHMAPTRTASLKSCSPDAQRQMSHIYTHAPAQASSLASTPLKSGPALEHNTLSSAKTSAPAILSSRHMLIPREVERGKTQRRAGHSLWQSPAVAPLQDTSAAPPAFHGCPEVPRRAQKKEKTHATSPYTIENPVFTGRQHSQAHASRTPCSAGDHASVSDGTDSAMPLHQDNRNSMPSHSTSISEPYAQPGDAWAPSSLPASYVIPSSSSSQNRKDEAAGSAGAERGVASESPMVVVRSTSGIGRKRFSEATSEPTR